MDKPADPATPLCDVYQPFLDHLTMHVDLTMHGRKPDAPWNAHGREGRVARFRAIWLYRRDAFAISMDRAHRAWLSPHRV